MRIKALSPEFARFYLDDIAKLRVSVWNQQLKETAFTNQKWLDEHDEHAFHWIVLNTQNKIIASARLCIHDTVAALPDFEEIKDLIIDLPTPIAMMSRLVVDPAYQKLGIARKLDVARLESITQTAAKSVILQVPSYRRKAIEKLNFTCLGKAKEKTFQVPCTPKFYVYVQSCLDV